MSFYNLCFFILVFFLTGSNLGLAERPENKHAGSGSVARAMANPAEIKTT